MNFAAWAPRPILERLAEGTVKAATTCTVAKVFDQHLNFIALESTLFTLALRDSYVQLNDNTATESQVSTAVNDVAEGLYGVCVTLGAIPVIRCAAGGLAEAVARALSGKIAAQLKGHGAALFTEAAPPALVGGGSGGRPLLCIFDRNFDLTPMVEQPFTYKALVHDCLGLSLNKARTLCRQSTAGFVFRRGNCITVAPSNCCTVCHLQPSFGIPALFAKSYQSSYPPFIHQACR